MKIHCIMTLYALTDEPQQVFDRINAPDITWHVYVNSSIPEVTDFAKALRATNPNVGLDIDPTNPGLAKCWNDGLALAFAQGADTVLIVNDDAIPEAGMAQRIARIAYENPQHYLTMCRMIDVPSGQIVNSQFGLCAINPIMVETIGYFDENFFPVYWEDIDLYRRAKLAGLQAHAIEDVGVTHLGSQTIRRVPKLSGQNNETFALNNLYYSRKWGSLEIGKETYAVPFNDPAFGLRINAEDRHAPYPGYNRADREVVRL